jgi:hypothetical protein
MFRSLAPQVLSGAFLAATLIVGCVEIPSEGHTPPDYKSSIRVMYLDPAITSSTSIMVAEGPDFDPFVSNIFQSGSFGTVTTYSTVNSGGKQLFLPAPLDPDTSAFSIATEQRGTLAVLPRPDVSMPRFLLIGEGRTFESVGITGASRVRVLNAVARSGSDTVDVAVDIFRTSDSTSVETGLAFGTFSDFIEVASDSSEGFYLVRAGSDEVLTGSVSVTGASNTDYTIVGSGSSDAASFDSFRNE